ncbi:MAG: hypothetical protein LBV34_09915 [Nocardiopsaceae bacterium]|nr:hypothetical protein [Nocardiopsaceae bacterium]
MTRHHIRTALTCAVALGALAVATPTVAQAAAGDARERIVISYLEVNGRESEGFRAFGPISGSGVGTQEWLDDRTVTATLPLAGGSVDVTVTIGDEHVDFDPRACKAVMTWTGTWAVTGGTGAYAAATGAGEAAQAKHIVGARIGGSCQGPESGVEPHLIRVRAVLAGFVNLA